MVIIRLSPSVSKPERPTKNRRNHITGYAVFAQKSRQRLERKGNIKPKLDKAEISSRVWQWFYGAENVMFLKPNRAAATRI